MVGCIFVCVYVCACVHVCVRLCEVDQGDSTLGKNMTGILSMSPSLGPEMALMNNQLPNQLP